MRQENWWRVWWGCGLIIAGSFALISNVIGGEMWSLAWPLFVFLPGSAFIVGWLNSKKGKNEWGLLIPGTIITGVAFTFAVNNTVSILLHFPQIWAWTVFAYPGSVAAAFWISGLASKNRGLLGVAKILTWVTLGVLVLIDGLILMITFLSGEMLRKWWPLLLVIIGGISLTGQWAEINLLRGRKVGGKSREEWKDWGENFGKKMETWGEKLEKELEGPKEK